MMARHYCLPNYIAGGTKLLKTPPANLESLSATKISGAPNTALQVEIAFPRTLSAVCSALFLVPIKWWQRHVQSVLNVHECGEISISSEIHFDQFVGSICDWYFRYHDKHPFLFEIALLSLYATSLRSLGSFFSDFPHKQAMFKVSQDGLWKLA